MNTTPPTWEPAGREIRGLERFRRTLSRRRGLIALCVVIVPVAALVFSLTQQKRYEASASLLFRDPGITQKISGSPLPESSADPTRAAATNVELVSLGVVADRTAGALARGSSRSRNKIVMTGDEVSKSVAVSAKGQSDVVSVTAESSDPEGAALLANEFARQYIAFRREADRTQIREARGLVQTQLDGLSISERRGPQGIALLDRARELDVVAALQTGNAELVQPAETPASASSPKPVRNTVLGLFAGLLLALGIAPLADRLDRRLRDPREVEEVFERPILAAIPKSPSLAREGDNHSSQRQLPPAEREAFLMLRANLRYFNVSKQVRSVLVTSAASGDGKSTVAFHLAEAVAATGGKALLIEADLRRPSLAQTLGMNGDVGLARMLAGEVKFGDIVKPYFLSTDGAQAEEGRAMDVILAGPLPPNPVDLIDSERMKRLIHEAEGEYDLVVIDTPPTSAVPDAVPLVREVDGVIVVSRMGSSMRDGMLHLRDQLRNLEAHTLGVVINAAGGRERYDSSYYSPERTKKKG